MNDHPTSSEVGCTAREGQEAMQHGLHVVASDGSAVGWRD